jgi:hypothetical protein
MRTWWGGTILVSALLMTGCTVVHVDESAQDPQIVEKLNKEVPTYSEADLAGNNDYIRVGSINAYKCHLSLLGGVKGDEVVQMLRRKARDMGANGLTDLSCGSGPVDELSGCVSSTACSATALKIVTPDPDHN